LNIFDKISRHITPDLDSEEDQGDFGPPNQQDLGGDRAWTSTAAVFTRSLPRLGPERLEQDLALEPHLLQKTYL
jgi:hypothetical protein